MKKIDDYNEFDYLCVNVKKEKIAEMEKIYGALKWTEVERTDDGLFSNIVCLTFKRPHKILHKDRLQLLQVKLEEKINNLSVARVKKHKKSTIFGLTFGILACLLIVLGIMLALKKCGTWNVARESVMSAIGYAVSAVGLACAIFCYILTKKLAMKENREFDRFFEKIKSETAEIWQEIQAINEIGEEIGKNELSGSSV